MRKRKSFFDAVAIYVGTAVGAGIFGLPYAFAQAGFLIGVFYLIFISLVFLLLTWLYSEVVLRTEKFHQITGYAEKYLGKKGKILSTAAVFFGLYGALVAYLIGVGNFLHLILQPYLGGQPMTYSLIFFSFVSIAILLGLGTVALIDRLMMILLLLVVSVIVIVGGLNLNYQNYQGVNWSQFFLPYGVVFFALAASSAVPNMKRLLPNQGKLKKAIFIGWLIPLIVYFLFTAAVIGVSGVKTTEMAVTGLEPILGHKIVILGSILGILTMTTSFLSLGLVLKEIYKYDFKLPNLFAWLTVIIIPFVIFLLQIGTFITVIDIAGAITGGLEGILIILMWQAAKRLGDRQPEYSFRLPKALIYLLFTIFVFGIGYQIYFTLIR